jgi:hypothetical protein
MKQTAARSYIVAVLLSVLGIFFATPALYADTTIGTPIGKLPYVIKKPGKYRLVKSLKMDEATAITAGSGISVPFSVSGSVVIDLNGYTITGPNTAAASTTIGIYGNSGTTVRNGTIFGFGTSVFANTVENITVRESVAYGIQTDGVSASVSKCKVLTGFSSVPPVGQFFVGIYGYSADIADCTVNMVCPNDNTCYGIIVNSGSSIRRCAVRGDTFGGVNPAIGIGTSGVNSPVLAENCMAYGFRHGFDGNQMRVQHCYAAGFADAAFIGIDRGAGNNF